jgi:uncharacterized protein involved in outer membrane biogenesis
MRIIIFGLSILALLAVGAVAAPSLIDWNKYKPQIISQIENATGLGVKIDGDLGLGIFPSPHVTVNDLTIASPRQKEFENILVMKSADISVALMPLLQKKVEIDSVKLINPVVKIEMMADGTPSWTIDKVEKLDEVVEAPVEQTLEPATDTKNNALDSISLEELQIVNGEFVYVDHRTQARHTAQNVNVTLKADSLKGPFDLDGDLTIDGKKIAMMAETGRLPTNNEPLNVTAEITLPEADAFVAFSGVASTKEPYDVQGKATMKIQSPKDLAKVFGIQSNFNESLSLDGLLTANQNNIGFDDLKLSIGDFVGSGKIKIDNLKLKNPLIVKGDIKSSSTLNLDKLMPASSNKKSENGSEGSASSASKTASKTLIPQTLTLPMNINADVQIDVAGVKYQGQTLKGAFIDLDKDGKTSKAAFKFLEMPGQGKVNGNLSASYASSSVASKTGQVTYSDPTVTYNVDGQIGQLSSFLKAFAPDADTSAITKLYKTAQFDLKGAVNAQSVSLKDSTLKLDQMVVGLGGRYTPAVNGGRPSAIIDLSAGEVDFDQIQAAQGKKTSASANNSGEKANPKKAVEPLKNFSLPMDLTFDVSLQKARINQADLNGLRLTGSMMGKQLKLTNASINSFAGATMNLKGQVANINELTGLDLTAYVKTNDLKKLTDALSVETRALPLDINALEASVTGKGTTKSLGFDANIKAAGGQLDVAGNATDLLGSPAYNNLVIGLKHPNLVKAIQIVSPSFKSQPGLTQPINFRSNANIDGKKIALSNMNTTLGKTNFTGNLNIDASGSITSVKGNIDAGQIALDDLLGAKSGSTKSSGGGSSSSSSSAKSSGRWSTSPIDLSFMNKTDVDVRLTAQSLTYGAWNLSNPATTLKIGGGQMNIDNMKAGVFGGSASFDANVKSNPVSLDVSSDMSGINLEKLAKALSGSGKLRSTGTVSFNMDVKSAGASASALINALNGKANLDGQDVTLIGFDLAKLARGLAVEEKLAVSALSLVEGATSGGQTKFDTVKGEYNISNGVVKIASMVMDSAEYRIDSTGNADLPKWFINVDNKITLKNVPDLEPFEVKIKGPLDNPTDTFGKNILEDYIQDKLKRKINKELGDKLPDVIGEDATNALQQFGILPKKQAPVAPTPAPANDNVAPAESIDSATPDEAQPVTSDPAPAQEEPKKIEKPEDAINELLKGDNPEEAINNVIKGLF